MHEFLTDIQPYLAVVNAAAAAALAIFLIRVFMFIRLAFDDRVQAVKDQKEVVTERLNQAKDDIEREKQMHEREVTRLKDKLSELLKQNDITLDSLIERRSPADMTDEDESPFRSTLNTMIALEEDSLAGHHDIKDPSWYIEIAKGLTAAGDWYRAARHYDSYIEHDPENWRVHYLRAVAYANARKGRVSDIAALRSYNDALAFMPTENEEHNPARLYGYRGAMLKRLGKLEEAESQLLLARHLATNRYEREDVAYNLACVYAMLEKRAEMFKMLGEIVGSSRWKEIIKGKRSYFSNYLEDREFLSLLD